MKIRYYRVSNKRQPPMLISFRKVFGCVCEVLKNTQMKLVYVENLKLKAWHRLSVFFPFTLHASFISNAMLKLAKKQAKAKQHPEAKLLRLEYYSLSSSTLSSKNN